MRAIQGHGHSVNLLDCMNGKVYFHAGPNMLRFFVLIHNV